MDTDLVSALRYRGVSVTTPAERGLSGVTDEEQLRFAAGQELVLYSFNVSDFYALHARWLSTRRHHAGMILARQQRLSLGEQLRRILRLRAAKSADEMRDCVESLSNWG